jgi:predicted alpha/beta superfamily hydrolase
MNIQRRRSTPDTTPQQCILRIHYDSGPGNRLTLRGQGGGLSWEIGVGCHWHEGNVWHAPPLRDVESYKPLLNDAVWARGDNFVTRPGVHDIYPFFHSIDGTVTYHRDRYWSHLDDRRAVAVYLPPSYEENRAKRYPILFMQDGQNLFDPGQATFGVAWRVDAALDHLACEGGITEALVVAPYSSDDGRMDEYTPTRDPGRRRGGRADAYLDFLLHELKPWVVDNFRTTGLAERVAIAGSSLGGLLSLYAAWTRPREFWCCGAFSPSLWWDGQRLMRDIETGRIPNEDLKIYLDSGDRGPGADGMPLTRRLRDILMEKSWELDSNLCYVLGEGHEHREAAWAERVHRAFAFLLEDPERVPPR